MANELFIADKATLDAVSSKLGNVTDSSADPIAGSMCSKLNAGLVKSEEIKTAITAISGNFTGNIIKSIQRGVIEPTSNDITVTINEINPSKSIVILDGGALVGSSASTYVSVFVKSLTATVLTISHILDVSSLFAPYDNYTGKIGYQIIEFM